MLNSRPEAGAEYISHLVSFQANMKLKLCYKWQKLQTCTSVSRFRSVCIQWDFWEARIEARVDDVCRDVLRLEMAWHGCSCKLKCRKDEPHFFWSDSQPALVRKQSRDQWRMKQYLLWGKANHVTDWFKLPIPSTGKAFQHVHQPHLCNLSVCSQKLETLSKKSNRHSLKTNKKSFSMKTSQSPSHVHNYTLPLPLSFTVVTSLRNDCCIWCSEWIGLSSLGQQNVCFVTLLHVILQSITFIIY